MTELIDGTTELSPFWRERLCRNPVNWREVRGRIEDGISKLIDFELRREGVGGVYVVLGSETSIEFCGDTYGITHPSMGDWFKRSIVRRGAWRGRGPGMLLDVGTMEDSRATPFEARRLSGAIAIHELTHIVLRRRLLWDKSRTSRNSGKEISQDLSTPINRKDDLRPVRLRTTHDLNFVRTGLHACYRADFMVFEELRDAWLDLLDWESIAPSGPGKYYTALMAEFDQLFGKPLSEIQLHPVPEQLTEIWEHDGKTLTTAV